VATSNAAAYTQLLWSGLDRLQALHHASGALPV